MSTSGIDVRWILQAAAPSPPTLHTIRHSTFANDSISESHLVKVCPELIMSCSALCASAKLINATMLWSVISIFFSSVHLQRFFQESLCHFKALGQMELQKVHVILCNLIYLFLFMDTPVGWYQLQD